MDPEVPIWDMSIRLLAAVGLAALIGLERELRGRPAGLRTHMLVSLGAAAFLLTDYEILFATATGDPSARIDPTRIVEGVIGGSGFSVPAALSEAVGRYTESPLAPQYGSPVPSASPVLRATSSSLYW